MESKRSGRRKSEEREIIEAKLCEGVGSVRSESMGSERSGNMGSDGIGSMGSVIERGEGKWEEVTRGIDGKEQYWV